MHKGTKSLLTSKPQTQSNKHRTPASFHTTSPKNSPGAGQSNVSNKHIKHISNLNIQETYDPLPSFGDEVRYGSTESPNPFPKSKLSGEFQTEKRSVESHRNRVSDDFGGKLSQVNHAVKDFKSSNSYLNAMRALQLKVKELQRQIEMSNITQEETEGRYQHEINILTQRFDKERQSLMDLENNLKTRLGLLEEELKDRERIVDNLSTENERLRNATQEIMTERTIEIEKLLNDKGRVKNENKELEGLLQAKGRAEEDLRMKVIQLECVIGEKENFCRELTEKIAAQEREKAELKLQVELKINEIVAKQKQAEDRNREIDAEYKTEMKRRAQKEEEMNQEMSKLKLIIRDLQLKAEQSDVRCKERENEVVEKSAQLLNMREELSTLVQSQEKSKNENDRTHSYAQDMAKMNQRLLTNLMGRSRSPEPTEHGQMSQTPRHGFSLQLPQGEGSVSEDIFSRRQMQSLRFEGVTEGRGLYSNTNTMASGEKSKGWMGSPGHQKESYYQGPKLSGEDLVGSGGFRGRSKSVSKEVAMDRMQQELVIKDIIEVEKETLELNREYQRLVNDMIGLDRDKAEHKGKKKRMEEIANKLQEKSIQLIQLKKKEEEIANRLRS